MKFSEHGLFSIEVQGQILVVDATGPFNDETLNHYHEALDKAIDSFATKLWQQIIVLHQSALLTPDAEKILRKTMRYRKERGLTASAVVLADVDVKPLIMHQLTRCYNAVGVMHAFFDDMPSANTWLAKLN